MSIAAQNLPMQPPHALIVSFDACEVCGGTNDTCALILIIMDAGSGLSISLPLLVFVAIALLSMLG